jgi:hypothetical protein
MAETLAQSLGTVPQGVPGVRDRASLLFSNEDIGKRGSQARALQPTLLKERATAETELETLKGQQQREQSEAEVRALEEDIRKQRAENVRVRGLEQPYKEFEAPQYTAADYAKGAAMRALTAVMLGGVAKTSALTQLKAIKAMQDAEKEGRQNDFLNAQLEFDQAEKKRVDFNERLKRDVEEFRDLLQKDTKLALAKAKIINSQLSGGIAAKTADVRSFSDYAKLLDEMAKTGDDLKIKTELEDIKGQYKLAEEQLKAGARQPTDRRLKQGERFNEETGEIVAIPGSDIFKKQKEKFSDEYKNATSVISQTENGLNKIDEILDEANSNGFMMNFGGYNAYATRYASGAASDMRKKIDSFKSDMKAAGKQLLAAGGSIGQITEREWPILEQMIASIDPVLSEDEARKTFDDIKNRFRRLIERTIDSYETEFSDSQFYRPLPLGGVLGAPQPSGARQPSAPTAPSGPQPGDVQDGYRFKGGDPGNASNWEKV